MDHLLLEDKERRQGGAPCLRCRSGLAERARTDGALVLDGVYLCFQDLAGEDPLGGIRDHRLTHTQNLPNAGVGYGVVDVAPTPLGLDEAAPTQAREMARNAALRGP